MLFPKNKRLELYNLENNPFETDNLISNYENKILVQSMFEELINFQKKYFRLTIVFLVKGFL